MNSLVVPWLLPAGAALLLMYAIGVVGYAHVNRRSRAGISTSASGRTASVGLLFLRAQLRKLRYRVRYLWASAQHRRQLEQQAHMQTAAETTELLGNMKGVFMKIGQIISFANESLPREAREIMAGLQQDAPPMSWELVEEVLVTEYDRPVSEVFRAVDREPVAAASIGQVHRAELLDGREVAVKVQYPGVDEAIQRDLQASQGLAFMINTVNRNIDANAVVQELKERLTDELDYRVEARNQQLFQDLWNGHPLIRIPDVIQEHTTRRVLVQEFCRGLSFEDFLKVSSPSERETAVYVLMDFGGVTFLDFGCVKFFSPDLLDGIMALFRALVYEDREAFRRAAEQLKIVLPGRPFDGDFLWSFFRYHAGPYIEDREFSFSRAWLQQAKEVMDPKRLQRINLPPDLIFFNRITFGLNAIFERLDASANFHRMYWRYLVPEDDGPPSGARLDVDLETRFLEAGRRLVTRDVQKAVGVPA